MMKNNAIPRPAADYKLEEFDNEILLYHPVKTQAIYLNESAALIWRLCDGQRDITTIRALLAEAYPERATQLSQDIEQTLSEFINCGAIELDE